MTAKQHTAIWDALSKTDPSHTKGFKRSGGFSGTAIKPIWIIHRLTEQFGPCGTGWGIGEPDFRVEPGSEGEQLVFCIVKCWHGKPENIVVGVGGDKVVGKNKYGFYSDDEAFKKAFTDAVNNAFKFIGVGADVHMGLFDDSKYVAEAAKTFAEWPDGPFKTKTEAKKFWRETAPKQIAEAENVEALNAIVIDWNGRIEQTLAYPAMAFWIEGGGEEAGGDWPGIKGLVQSRRAELKQSDLPKLLAEMQRNASTEALKAWVGEPAIGDRIDALSDVDQRTFEAELDELESQLTELQEQRANLAAG